VSEHFAFENVFGYRAAVDGDEIVLLAMAVVMQAARNHFLACAGVAIDEHVGAGVRNIQYEAPNLLHRGGLSQQRCFDAFAAFEAGAAMSALPASGCALPRRGAATSTSCSDE